MTAAAQASDSQRSEKRERNAAIEVQDLEVRVRGSIILEAINLTVEPGDFLGIIGPNGGGKTTLLRALLGLVRPERGTIRIFGKPPSEARGQMAYVPQHTRFDTRFPIRVLDVVLLGRLARNTLFHRIREEDRAVALEALRSVRLEPFIDRQIGRLSGGQLQRVLIARALAARAPLLLLDEPTASLDPTIGEEIYALLEELRPDKTVVLVSHDVSILSRHARGIACLNRTLVQHSSSQLTREMLESTFGGAVSLLVHQHHHAAPKDE